MNRQNFRIVILPLLTLLFSSAAIAADDASELKINAKTCAVEILESFKTQQADKHFMAAPVHQEDC